MSDVGRSPREAASSDAVAEAGGCARRATVHDLRIEIDTDLCVGFGDCVDAAPDAFRLDGAGIAYLTAPESVDRSTLLEACRSCPVDAIVVRNDEGEVLAP